MIYVITDREIKTFQTLEDIDIEERMLIDKTELHSIGADYIVKLTNRDIDFVRDKYKISNLVLEKLYGKNTKEEKENNKRNIVIGILGILLLISISANALLFGLAL